MITKTNSLTVSETVFNLLVQDADFSNRYTVYLDTFNNCRETVYMLTIYKKGNKFLENYIYVWVCECRNSDDIMIVYGNNKSTTNMFYETEYNHRKSCRYGDFIGAKQLIIDTIDKITELSVVELPSDLQTV